MSSRTHCHVQAYARERLGVVDWQLCRPSRHCPALNKTASIRTEVGRVAFFLRQLFSKDRTLRLVMLRFPWLIVGEIAVHWMDGVREQRCLRREEAKVVTEESGSG
jgi:hypothetical protein